MHLKKLSAQVVCCKQLPNITEELSLEANSVDPEQTAPRSSLVWVHTVCHRGGLKTFQQTRKAENFCCDWCITGIYINIRSYFLTGMAGSQLWKIYQKNSKSSTAGYQTPRSHLWRCCMEPTGLFVSHGSL